MFEPNLPQQTQALLSSSSFCMAFSGLLLLDDKPDMLVLD
jgi:hypothetical protein